MLHELHIRNFSIIDDITVEFEKGFNVITGETGAGKSVIINALSLALGERASGDVVRSGEKEAVIEAFFDVSPGLFSPRNALFFKENGIDISDGLVLKRGITPQGRSKAYVNGAMVNVQRLSEISGDLIDVHGQYEHQSLLSTESQMDLLDSYGGLLPLRRKVSDIYESILSLRQQKHTLTEKEKERSRRLDMLRFQISEIDAAQLSDPAEEEALMDEGKILANAGRLAELAHQAYESLYASDASCLSSLSAILRSIREMAGIDGSAKEALKSAEEAVPLLEETAYFLRDYRDRIDFSPERLERCQERLETIKGLKRKYGASIDEVLSYKDSAVREMDELLHSGERLESIDRDLQELKLNLTGAANDLSAKRKSLASLIESKIEGELSELSMPGTKFSIQVLQEKGDDTADGFSATHAGIDNIEFLISPNVGEKLKPVAKIASGGELSRVMLALKGIMAKGDKIPVLIFDEIDAGIGGRAAETVGEKLRSLAASRQIISITHLPQIASRARNHLKIEKKTKGKRTIVHISRIDKDERTAEVARMLSGNISDTSLKHAQELLRKTGK